ncbi:hypothetical protein GCM10009127_10830 [Alteraurantiacibacter aestuarii]|uniref:DNA ligase D polymerase domain-containing protein n=1 Tax=Alteraurantiacibacter aestuarii TaxID=650004 RepID=A0A844ZG28_9SPHN|nr:hypothetical protein [Alteraurantiacibacter aestuarii]
MTDAEPRITSRDRVIFPDSGQTKGDLADYYAAIAPLMLPFVALRPISLVRCPQGRAKKCFYQKHDSGGFGPHVHTIAITEKSGKTQDYLYVPDAAGLLACVQMGTIEFHPWPSTCADLEAPDRLVFDLDPGEGIGFAQVRQAAFAIRERLLSCSLASFAMLTGGKGLHVVVPLRAGHSWDRHRQFARDLATGMSAQEPDRFTASISKAGRQGRIFIDYLRNQRGNTAVAPYSARARAGAPVAAPVTWEELADIAGPQVFAIGDAAQLLLRAQGGALSGWGVADQQMPAITL